MDSGNPEFRNYTECSKKKKTDHVSELKLAFRMLDATFFNSSKMLEIEKGALELNIPIFRSNRKLVASTNGGLHNPSCLVFNSDWKREETHNGSKRFSYPSISGVKRPKDEEDIAFMTILELGQLIRTKQITSEELVGIFLRRLKRFFIKEEERKDQ